MGDSGEIVYPKSWENVGLAPTGSGENVGLTPKGSGENVELDPMENGGECGSPSHREWGGMWNLPPTGVGIM